MMPTRRPRWVAAALAGLEAGRTCLGVAALVLPEVPTKVWIGDRASGMSEVRVLCRGLGARDLVLGLAPLLATRRSHAVTRASRGWVLGGVCADAGDALATVVCWGSVPKRGRRIVLAASCGAVSAGLAAYPLG
jgi:hypothetical protein